MAINPDARGIFLSHTHSDKKLADAFRDLIDGLFEKYWTVKYSTDEEHGPQHGERWLGWIEREVRNSAFTLVFLTPSSQQKPWILWEAGAVAGTAVATGKEDARRVRPLLFRIPTDQVPDPFRNVQLAQGDDYESMRTMLFEWMENLPRAARYGARLDSLLKNYLKTVGDILDNAPLVPTEPVIQEWIGRLDELRVQNRMSEVRTLHEWLNIAFGREHPENPLDVRLHRRLGDLYLNARNYEEAIKQFELARLTSPRDILVLRELGRAYLGAFEQGNEAARNKAAETIDAIEKLDPKAFERNVECAALKGRWLRSVDPAAAREVYQRAFHTNPSSYYVGDLLGQMQLQLKDVENARHTYDQVRQIIEQLGERNLWVQATLANALIAAQASPDRIAATLREIRTYAPSPENLRSIEDGLRRVQESIGADEGQFRDWIAALRG